MFSLLLFLVSADLPEETIDPTYSPDTILEKIVVIVTSILWLALVLLTLAFPWCTRVRSQRFTVDHPPSAIAIYQSLIT
jgi:hypothetical protein